MLFSIIFALGLLLVIIGLFVSGTDLIKIYFSQKDSLLMIYLMMSYSC
jgi:hypothetical protein